MPVCDANLHTTSNGLQFLEVKDSWLRAAGLSSAKLGSMSRHKGRIVYLAYGPDTIAFTQGLDREKIELNTRVIEIKSDWILDLWRADGKGRAT